MQLSTSPVPPMGVRSLAALAALGATTAAVVAVAAGGGPPAALPHLTARQAAPVVPLNPAPVVRNAGQSDPQVRFEARAAGGAAFFTARSVVLARPAGVVRLGFAGARADAALRPVGRGSAVVNDLRAGAAGAGLATYSGVRYARVWPGIDVRLDARAAAGGPWVAAGFTLAPGADLHAIGLRFDGTTAPWVDRRTGDLRVLPTRGGRVVAQPAPIAWQVAGDGRHTSVDVGWTVADDGTVSLSGGRYDHARPLLIAPPPHGARGAQATPPALQYSTYAGATKWDEAYDVDVDAAGNAYVTGFTFSLEFPRRGSARGFAGVQDATVQRYDPQGRLVYSTILGGGRTDVAQNIAVDRDGNAYVTGRTLSKDFPTRSPMQRRLKGKLCQNAPCSDAFVTKLNPAGQVVYSTFFGGSADEDGWGIAVDSAGAAYVTGNTTSPDLPTQNAFQRRNRSVLCTGGVPCPFDIFVTKLAPDGQSVVYSTYLGGRQSELSGGIAVDANGNAFVSGSTRSSNFPTRRPRQARITGVACGPPPGVPCTDAFLTKLDPTGRKAVFSTYFGGTKSETGVSVALDQQGRAYLAGSTQSTDFPLAGAIQGAIGNSSCTETEPKELCDDAFVAGFQPDGRHLRFSTFLGGNAEDQALGVAVDRTGAIHVAGSTDSRAFRTVAPLQAKLGGAIDAFVATLAPGGRQLLMSTYVGGKENERFSGIAVDASGNVLLAGRSNSPNFPVAAPAQGALAGDIDAVVTKVR